MSGHYLLCKLGHDGGWLFCPFQQHLREKKPKWGGGGGGHSGTEWIPSAQCRAERVNAKV